MSADRSPMLPVAQALALVLEAARPLRAESVALEQALGRVAAVDIAAAHPLPPFVASVKDGYAVVASDGPGAYPVVGAATAGRMANFRVQPGQVAYITTGAPLPPGADAVVMVEETTQLPSADGARRVQIRTAAAPGQDLRPVGYDVAQGAVVVAAGTRLGPAEIGIAATAGVEQVQVHARPRVGVLSTGDELAPPGAPLPPGAIHDSNGPMLRAAVAAAGGQVVNLGIARDDAGALHAAFAAALEQCDLLVTTGGVSMGELDLIRGVIEARGTVHFGRLLLKPGKPCLFATVAEGDQPKLVFGLPGNPVSSLVTFWLLVLPAIQRMAGLRNPGLRRVQAQLTAPLRLDAQRPEYHRAHLVWQSTPGGGGGWLAQSTGNQASSRLLSLVGANALLELPQGAGQLEAGATVDALLIETGTVGVESVIK